MNRRMRCLLKIVYWLMLGLLIAGSAGASVYLRRANSLHLLIVREAAARNIDSRLALALVHDASRCEPSWSAGDRFGLLAVSRSELAGWNKALGAQREVFDLFDPELNLRIGFDRFAAIQKSWRDRRDPDRWALAEWMCGPERARVWAEAADHLTDPADAITDRALRVKIDGMLARLRPGSLNLRWPRIPTRADAS